MKSKLKHYTRHKVLFSVLRFVIGPLVKVFMGYRYERQKGPDRPCLVISNHNTDLDPALLGMAFSRHMYFVASEHAFRAGFGSKLMNFVFGPIPINKAQTDVHAIMELIRRIKAGASVCLFAEGDRSFNGLTSPVHISTAKLVKKIGADLITYRLEGAYFVSPRWGKKRKGIINGKHINKYTAEELSSMSDADVLKAIREDIFEDAYLRQKENPCRYNGKNLAENIETVLYLCPDCNTIGTIKSKRNRFFCQCGLEGEYTKMGYLEGDSLPFSTITDWDKWQTGYLAKIVRHTGYDRICTDENQQLFVVQPTIDKILVAVGEMYIDRTVFHCAGMTFLLEDIARFAVAGQQILLFGLNDGTTYEIRSETPRSALKYREIFNLLTGN